MKLVMRMETMMRKRVMVEVMVEIQRTIVDLEVMDDVVVMEQGGDGGGGEDDEDE